MLCVYTHAGKNVMLFIKEKDMSAIMPSDILANPLAYEQQINKYGLVLDTIGNAVVLVPTVNTELSNITKPFSLYCLKVLQQCDFKIERDLATVINRRGEYTFEEFSRGCKEFNGVIKGEQQEFGVLNSKTLTDNTMAYGDLNAIAKFKPDNSEEVNSVEEDDDDSIVENECSPLNLTVPSVYDIWQIFDATLEERDILGTTKVTRYEEVEGSATKMEMTYEEPEYAVTYGNIDGNIIFNIGVFNRNLARDLKMVDRLLNTEWSSALNADEIKDSIVGTKENSFMPIQDNEKGYYEKLLNLAKDCLVYENYDGQHGTLDLRKDLKFTPVNNKPLENGISLEEAKQYVDVEALLNSKAKSDLFTDYVLWLADLSMCANRPHLGYVDYPTGYAVALEGALADIRGEVLDEDEVAEKPKFNADSLLMQRTESLNYKQTLVRYLVNLPTIEDQITAIIKMLRWGSRKCSYINVEGEPKSLSLENFDILFILDDNKVYEDEIREDGSNRYITQFVLADSDLTDSAMAKSLTNPAKFALLGFNIRKKYKGINAYVDSYVDVATVIDEYVNNNNKFFKITGIEYDKVNCQFVIDQDSIVTIANTMHGQKSVVPVSTALRNYNKGLGTIDLVISPTVGEILANETTVDNIKYSVANFFTAYQTFTSDDNIMKNVKGYLADNRKLYKNIMMTARTGAKVKFMNIALMARYTDFFKNVIDVTGNCLQALTTEGVTFKEDMMVELFNKSKNIVIPTGTVSDSTTQSQSVNSLSSSVGLGQIFLDRIGQESKEILEDARVFVDGNGQIVAYGVKPVSKQESFFIKLYDPKLVEVKSIEGKNTPLDLLLKKLIVTIKKSTGADKMKLFRLFYANVHFQSEKFRDYLKDNVVDWTSWV